MLYSFRKRDEIGCTEGIEPSIEENIEGRRFKGLDSSLGYAYKLRPLKLNLHLKQKHKENVYAKKCSILGCAPRCTTMQ